MNGVNVFNQPLVITEHALNDLLDRARDISAVAKMPPAKTPLAEPAGDGVAVLHISGPLTLRPTAVESALGFVSVEQLATEFKALANDSSVNKIVLRISSPGGSATGISEFASLVASTPKHTVAFTDSMMASGSYWIGAMADEVVATGTSQVGSIGVVVAVPDVSKALNNAGVAFRIFRSGDLKAPGLLGSTLSDTQASHLQSQLDVMFQKFVTSVRSRRRISDEVLRGGVYLGFQAQSLGLVDRLANSFDHVVTGAAGNAIKAQAVREFQSDCSLRAEFGCVDDYVRFKEAEASGRARVFVRPAVTRFTS